jgi:capsular exopolysaccharide synthesis family protein
VLIGLVVGLGFGFLVAIISESRDTSFKSMEELGELTGMPVLAVIPYFPDGSGKPRRSARWDERGERILSLNNVAPAGVARKIVTLSDPHSVPSEQYGFLAMNVRQRCGRTGSKVVAITSAAGGEGKTLTSINLAVMLSRTGPERVLLVECDLRRPWVHEYLGLSPSRGLATLLRRPDDPLEPYLATVGPLTVLPGGSPLSDALELLSSDQTRVLFHRLRARFQYVVADLPPIVPIADSKILVDLSDGVVVVVRANQTPRDLLAHALERIQSPKIWGAVLNGLEMKRYAYAYEYYGRRVPSSRKERAVAR